MSGLRLQRLDLTRYGHFAGASLDFGTARPCDVTIVYGDNEAGKSTAFAAWLDLLFGMAKRNHPYAFSCDRSELEVGARLQTDGTAFEIRRTATSLLDGTGHTLEEVRLKGFLRNLDREAYTSRFSLNDETLRAGGEAIASGKGDLGEALHLGASGTAGVGDAIKALAERADAFHKKGGRTTRLALANREIKDLRSAIREGELPPRDWDRLKEQAARAGQSADDARAAFEAAGRALALCDRALEAQALDAQIADITTSLATLPDGPDLPQGAEAKLAAAATTLSRSAEEIDDITGQQQANEAALAAIEVDTEALAMVPDLDRIASIQAGGSSLFSRAESGRADIANRRAEAQPLIAMRAAILAQLELSPATLPSATALAAIDTALAAYEGAVRDQNHAADTLKQAQSDLPETVIGAGDPQLLETALDALPDPREATRLKAALSDTRDQLVMTSTGLPQDWAALVNAVDGLPEAAEIDALADAVTQAKMAFDTAADAQSDAERGLTDTQTSLAISKGQDLVTDPERDAARVARDVAWDRHRAALTAGTADDFAAAMRADDAAGARHAAGEAARLRLANAQAAVTVEEEKHGKAVAKTQSASATLQAACDATAAMAARLGLSDGAPVTAHLPRLRQLGDAARASHAVARAEAALAVEIEQTARAEDTLRRLLGTAEAPDLRLAARTAIDDLKRQNALTDSRARAAKRVAEAKTALETVTRAVVDAQADLARQTAGTALVRRTPAELRAALTPLREAAEVHTSVCRLEIVIAKVEADIARFTTELAAVAEPGDNPVATFETLRRRAKAAIEQDRKRRELIEKQVALGASCDQAIARQADARQTRDTLLAGQDSDSVTDLLTRDALRAQLATTNDTLAAILAEPGVKDALAHADLTRRAALKTERTAADETYREALQSKGAADRDLRAAENAPGAAEARQSRAALLAELAAEARAAAAAALAVRALRRALHTYQEDNRGALLTAAEAAFARLTSGEWTRLEARADGTNGQALFVSGKRPATRVDNRALSTGTRGQIYLALRLAGHAAFAQTQGALPFVLDDVTETFDDTRARATMTMLGELGTRGQAILLTHHQHLVDMAREAIPDVRVVDMPPRGA